MASQNRQTAADEVLCRQAQAGDQLAEETLIVRYARTVRRCAHPLFLMGGDAEDLFQEGLLGLLSAIRDYRDDRSAGFGTYAETCIRNRLSSAVLTANRLKHAPLNTSVPLDGQEAEELRSASSPEQEVIGREESRELSQMLQGILTPTESRVLDRYCDGYSYREIADQLGVTTKTVDNAVQRIKRKLAKRKP